jgi:hypothetical protein
VSASGLVSNPIVDNVEMFSESLHEAALRLAHVLLLALGAGDQVHQVTRRTVHVAIDPDRLTCAQPIEIIDK